MRFLYKLILLTFIVFCTSLYVAGQGGGIVKTYRSSPTSVVSFSASAKLSAISDAKHVDGYVEIAGSNPFVFPVGHKGIYRPFMADGNGTTGAYFKDDPSAVSVPAAGPFNVDSMDGSLTGVSRIEFWDINGITNSNLTLTWTSGSNISGLVGGNLSRLCIAGWNSSTGRWEKIPSLVDAISLQSGTTTLTSGSITTVQRVVPNTYSIYTLGALASPSLPASYRGILETADCSEVVGWAWNANYPEMAVTLELVEGATVHAMVTANMTREDLIRQGIGTGKYGFRLAIPAHLRDGQTRQLSIRVKNSSYLLGGSPASVSCKFDGAFEVASCQALEGWVWNEDLPDQAQIVELVEGNSVYGSVLANNYREDLKVKGKGSANYGFSFSLPSSLMDSKPRRISLRVQNTNYILSGSARTISCAPSQYSGRFEFVDCNMVQGYAWDRNNPNAAVTVELLEGNTVHATVAASSYRAYLKDSGVGTGNYGFSFQLPMALKSGQARSLSIRVKGTGVILTDSPRSVNCPAPVQNVYSGRFEFVDCNTVQGYAWDKNNPRDTLTVELLEGNTVYATALASSYRAYLKDNGVGTGNYGFSFLLPATLKNGQPRSLSIRIKNTSTILTDSPRSVMCVAPAQYAGRFEVADCNVVQGYAWDKSNPNAAVTVELLEGNTVHATALANLYRADLKESGVGTGNYGFSIPLPAALKNGQSRNLSVRVRNTAIILTDSPRSLYCPAPSQYSGRFEFVDCNMVQGYAWDRNNPNAAVTVELLEGNTVHATVAASSYRAYLKDSGVGTGNYGFSFQLPMALKSGQARSLSIRVKGTGVILTDSPRSVNCPAPVQNVYSGRFEFVDCNTVQGYAWDKNNPRDTLTVELLEGNTVYATALASSYRAYLKDNGVGTGNYGFSFLLPVTLKNGQPRSLSIRIKNTSTILTDSPRSVMCVAPAQYAGRFEVADCNVVQGYAWDKSNPNAAVTVELLEGNTVHATALANLYRADLKESGVGTGNYGFSIPLPAALKNGQSRNLSVRVRNTAIILTDSPRSLYCPAPSQYSGRFEFVDCNMVQGYAWDRNNPNAAVTVELLEGNTVHATVAASSYRAYLKDSGVGTGNYGFSFQLPMALKSGQARSLSIRVKGTGVILTDSPRSVNCPAPVQNVYSGRFEFVDCNTVQGYAWDKNNPRDTLTVELLEGNTVYATALASSYRAYLKDNGVGTGNYGFSFLLPATLKNGQPRSLSIRIKNTSTILTDSPRSVTCFNIAREYAIDSGEVKLMEDSQMYEQLAVSPNPTTGPVLASFGLGENEHATLSVVTMTGEIVWKKSFIGTGEVVKQAIVLVSHNDKILLIQLQTSFQRQSKRVLILR